MLKLSYLIGTFSLLEPEILFEMLKIPPISTIYYLMGLQAKKG